MSSVSLEPCAALARISATPSGWLVDCRGPHGAWHRDVATLGEAAELAILLRDQGKWPLRYSPAAEVVKDLVRELTEGGAAC